MNSEIRAMSHDGIDAVAAGAKGEVAVIGIKVPGVTLSTVIKSDTSGVVLQYSSGKTEGQRV
jgi:predicted Fe-Mo cluster-binding NifX family protein